MEGVLNAIRTLQLVDVEKTKETIKEAFNRLAIQFHPDKGTEEDSTKVSLINY
jgi:DnaJ-class molecular chaperone